MLNQPPPISGYTALQAWIELKWEKLVCLLVPPNYKGFGGSRDTLRRGELRYDLKTMAIDPKFYTGTLTMVERDLLLKSIELLRINVRNIQGSMYTKDQDSLQELFVILHVASGKIKNIRIVPEEA